jgi:hypothetical protein
MEKFTTGTFVGVDKNDAFAQAALNETPVVVALPQITWPDNLGPKVTPFGSYKPGEKITTALTEKADVLILLYTDMEISALLDVFFNKSTWTTNTKKIWYPYSHNFSKFKDQIKGGSDNALKDGIFGYLYSLTIGTQKVVLYKTELHPKNNGKDIPFIPVIAQLVSELQPKLVISTGTAGAVGNKINCGDVVIADAARFHLREQYPSFPDLNTMSTKNTQLKNSFTVNKKYVQYAAANFTKLSLPGLTLCYNKLGGDPQYSFLKKNTQAPNIYVTNENPAPGPEPMDIVSADYLTVDDNNNSEGLQKQGAMNDTDDAFAFYAIGTLAAGSRPRWISVRNASEPQINVPPFPPGTTPGKIIDTLKGIAGAIYGVYQYCTTLNSAFACWAVIAGMN